MSEELTPYSVSYDLSNCDAEPIQHINLYQDHGLLIVIDLSSELVCAVSQTAVTEFGLPAHQLLNQPISFFLPAEIYSLLPLPSTEQKRLKLQNPIHVPRWARGTNKRYQNMVCHRTEHHLLLEFEERFEAFTRSQFLQEIDQSMQSLQLSTEEMDLYQQTVEAVQRLAGFDRVMIYRFDEEYNGEVIAEAKQPHQEAYLHLRYPHTDIPAQARALYLRNGIRHITSTQQPQTNYIYRTADTEVLDLSMSTGRGVSPFHLEYLNNMGVGASLSAAIVVDQRLWGLIACHHDSRKLVDYRMRNMIGLFAKIVAGQLALHETIRFREQVLQSKLMRSRLFKEMSENYDVLEGLRNNNADLLNMVNAKGVALLFDQQIILIGATPTHKQVKQLSFFLAEKEDSLFATEKFFEEHPEAKDWQNAPAGVLAVRISQHPAEFIIWLRPEISKTINWGGSPEQRKIVEEGRVRLHPELSFRKWEQRVADQADEWKQHELDAALALRNDIKEIILRKYQEIRQLNSELTAAYEELESFSYTVSHDLRAPLRTIHGFAEILDEDYAHKLDEYGHSVIQTIINSVGKMNQFINDILDFSRLGRIDMIINELDLNEMIPSIWQQLPNPDSKVALDIKGPLPKIPGDYTQIRQLFQNMLSNAIKYSQHKEEPLVEIQVNSDNKYFHIDVKDNGIGFDMKYAERIFAVFHRLVNAEEYPGTGVGLAIAKRIMDKHHGKIAVDSTPGVGTTFRLSFCQQLSLESE